MNLAEKIQNLRKEKQLSQEELAEKLDISRQSVSKWESGLALPEIDKIIMLGEIFNVTTDYLLKDGEVANNQESFAKEEIPAYKIKRLAYDIRWLTVIFCSAMIGLTLQFLLAWFSIVSFISLAFIAGIFVCFSLYIATLILLPRLNSKLEKSRPKTELEKIENSSHLKITRRINTSLLFSWLASAALVIYTHNKIIAILCFLFTIAYAGVSIFTVLKKRMI